MTVECCQVRKIGNKNVAGVRDGGDMNIIGNLWSSVVEEMKVFRNYEAGVLGDV